MKFNHALLTVGFVFLAMAACKNDKKKDKIDANKQTEMNEKAGSNSTSDTKMNAKKDEMNLAQVAMNSSDHSTLVSAIKSAGLTDELRNGGPFTIFAPNNSAFNNLPKGTVEELMKPENKEKLQEILKNHVVKGKIDTQSLRKMIKDNHNRYTMKTLAGGKIVATINDAGNIVLLDERGKKSTVVNSDMKGSNGVIHSINTVLMRS